MAGRLGACVLAMSLTMALTMAQTVFAADAPATPSPAPLAPAGAAGLHTAQNGPNINKTVVVAGLGLAALGIYFIVGTHYKVPSQHSASGTK